MAFVMASVLVDGRRAGFAAVAGIVTGGVIHIMMSATGVGLVLQRVPQLFNAMLIAGALYIAWMGCTLVSGATALGEIKIEKSRSLRATFVRAVLTCLLNPKAYIFMLAVFPQFLRLENGSLISQSIILGAMTSMMQFMVYGVTALLAAETATWLRENKTRQIHVGRFVGLILVASAFLSVWQGWSRS